MSPRRASLSRAPVIAGVMVLLAAVVVFNIRTFAPGHGKSRLRPAPAAVAATERSSLLMDLEDVLRQSGRPAGDPLQVTVGPRPAIARDPFSGGRRVATAATVTGPVAAPVAPAARAAAPVPARDGRLACAAVMLGSGAPAALIDGRLYRVGDTVRGLRVVRIDARGVALAGDGALFLPVGVAPGGGTSGVVNGELSADRLGRTSLAQDAESERK